MKTDELFVTMDPRDNSVTLSPALFAHLGGFESCHRIYVFGLAGSYNAYAFMVNPDFDVDTQIADVQVNTKTKEVGFECLIPSVAMMFARNVFDLETPRRVPVIRLETQYDSDKIYQLDLDSSVYCQ